MMKLKTKALKVSLYVMRENEAKGVEMSKFFYYYYSVKIIFMFKMVC